MLRTSIFLVCIFGFGSVLAVEDACSTENPTGAELICSAVNAIRDILENGIETMGIPPLDPLNVKDIPLTFKTDFLSGQLHLQNLTLEGLSSFSVLETGNIIAIKLPLIFNPVKLFTVYNGDLNLFGKLHVFGNGNITLGVSQLNLQIELNFLGKTMKVTLLDPLPLIETTFTGLLNDEFMSGIISTQLGDTVTTLISEHIVAINEFLGKIAQDFIDSLLGEKIINKVADEKELTLDDIKDIVNAILSVDVSNMLKKLLTL